jgi:hypothetical protein
MELILWSLFMSPKFDLQSFPSGNRAGRGGDADEAWATFAQYEDKNWSFTDCSSKVVMDQMTIAQAFAFDQHFRQFGTVNMAPQVEDS